MAYALPESLVEAQQLLANVVADAAAQGRVLDPPPEQPHIYSCCGRGCDPCIFTVYYAALHAWAVREA